MEPIVCALNDKEIKAVGYNGSISDKDKEESHMSWHNGHVTVMVATRASGLGINKKNIRLIVQHGLSVIISRFIILGTGQVEITFQPLHV